MRAVIVYDSAFGNTAQVARKLADELVTAGHTAELVSLRTHRGTVVEADLLLVGGPTRFGRMTRRVAEFLRRLDAARWSTRTVVLFDTFGPTGDLPPTRWKETKALTPGAAGGMRELALRRGLNVYPGVLRCRVSGLRGPLAPEALDATQAFARTLLDTLASTPPTVREKVVETPPLA